MGPKAFRESLGMTQTEVASAVGISQGTVSKIEAGSIPNGVTMRLYDRWADRVARERRIRVENRLSWAHLLDDVA